MKVTILRTLRNGATNLRKGSTVTMAEARAKELLARGLVSEVKAPAPKNKAAT
jgi:hypothetical protein